MALGIYIYFLEGKPIPDMTRTSRLEIEPPSPISKEELNHLLQLSKKEAIILTEEAALPAAHFLLTELTNKGRTVCARIFLPFHLWKKQLSKQLTSC